jgi:putative aldouronate transport system substrate-binding protein
MKRLLTKTTIFGISTCLVAVALIGCSNKSENIITSLGETEQVQDKIGDVPKLDKIKFMINVGLTVEDGVLQWIEEYEKFTGIKLDFNAPTAVNDYYTNLDLSFTAGTSPDVFNVGDNKLSNYVAQGALANLTELVEKSELSKTIDSSIWDSVKVNGQIYGVPFEEGGGTITYVREDWLEESGVEAPTNYNEFINMLRAFKQKYPQMIPYTAPGLYENQAVIYLREFYQEATPEFSKVDGKWVDGLSEDNMVEALTRLSEAYKEGLIDQEIVTNKTSTCRDLWYAGKVGVFNYWAGTWAQSLSERLANNVPESKVLQLPAIEETFYMQRTPVVTAISSKSKNIEEVFKYFIEYMHDGGEGQVLFESGVENVHWKQEGDKLVQLPKLSNPDEVSKQAFKQPSFALTEKKVKDKNIEHNKLVMSSIEISKQGNYQLENTPLSKTYSKKSSEITALKSSTIAEIVMGKVDVITGLENYKKKVSALNMEQILLELNE